MKKSATTHNKPAAPSLFRVAAQNDDQLAAAGKSMATLQKKPLADLMLHPEKVEAVLEITKGASQVPAQSPTTHEPQMTAPTTAPKKNGGPGKTGRRSLVKTKFHLEAPTAKAVKLAADFTDWEKSPIDLTKSADGVWQKVVPLPPGKHSYRFIVDGQWCDDPLAALLIPNPFGTANAVTIVT